MKSTHESCSDSGDLHTDGSDCSTSSSNNFSSYQAPFSPSTLGQAPMFSSPQQATNVPSAPQNNQFIKGALIGAGIALILGNDSVQKAVMKGATSLFNAAQAGVEEIKEKFEDVQAEMKDSSE